MVDSFISFHQNYIVIFDLRIVGLYISALVSFFLHHCLSSWRDIIKSLYYILHTMYLQLIYLVDTSQLGQQKNEWLPGFQQKCQNIASIYILSRLCALNKQPFKLNFWLTYHLVFLVFYLQSTSAEKNMNDKVRFSGFKVHIFWEGHKILRNLPLTFDCMYCSQK